jgi:Response regulator receiver domain
VIKVLCIEDNEDNVYMLKMRLELLGDFEVLTAEDGEKGCEMAAAERPDIILMDLEMPVVDGWEPHEGSRPIHKLATSPLSLSPRTRSPVNAKRRSRRSATSSTPSRSNLIGWSQPFGAFSPTVNEANPRMCVISKGMDHRSSAVAFQRFRTIKICPKEVAFVWLHSRAVIEGARHERHRSAGFSPLRMRVDIAGRASVLVNEIGAIGDQAGGNGAGAFIVDRGQLVPGCQRDDQSAMKRASRGRRSI